MRANIFWVRLLGLVAAIFLLATGCNSPTTTDTIPDKSDIGVIWGMGNEIPAAQQSPINQQAPIRMLTSWFSKPSDLDWMRNYPDRNTMAELYAQGYAQELVIYLADYTDYAVSQEFQADLRELIQIFKGNGPDYGPLYVVLFTEYETYSDDPAYFQQLKEAFLQSRKTIKDTYAKAYVGMGFGGYEWSGIEVRDFKDWEVEVLKASDFAAVQAHHRVKYMDRMVPQIRNSVRQLGSYGKPVMLSHFRIWQGDGETQAQVQDAFQSFINEMFTEESMQSLTQDGLFAFSFFADDYINNQGSSFDSIKKVVDTYASKEIDLGNFK